MGKQQPERSEKREINILTEVLSREEAGGNLTGDHQVSGPGREGADAGCPDWRCDKMETKLWRGGGGGGGGR